MNKYEKLITALQCSGDGIVEEADGLGCANKKCKYRDADGACNLISMTLDAAAAITALQSENGSKDREIERLKSELLEAREDYMASEMEREQGVDALARVEAERDAAQKCIYDVETYLELGSGAYIVKTIQAWKNGAQGEG